MIRCPLEEILHEAINYFKEEPIKKELKPLRI